jgi:outer membrane lipoprotein carrier protein
MVVVKFWFRAAISGLLALLGMGLSTGVIAAESATEDLQSRLQNLDGIVATFDQTISNSQGFLIEQANGTLHLAKPRFRWEVQAPFPQIILANGDQIQIYDPDLEQVTERQIDGSLDQAPLALLTRSDLMLDQHFAVQLISEEQGTAHFVLQPLADDALFSSLEMIFQQDRLSTLVISDHAGQQTLIRFADYQSRQVIQSSVFELVFPPGTDFVRG